MHRQLLIAANWKMHKTGPEVSRFLQGMLQRPRGDSIAVWIAVPFPFLPLAKSAVTTSNVRVGAQNMHDELAGAYTGEVSALMLLDAGADFVILGHSERRCLFHENNDFIGRKVHRAMAIGLRPLLCVGETLEERQSYRTEAVIARQLALNLAEVDKEHAGGLVIAYEPVWAIGTGETATPELAQQTHAFIRRWVRKRWGSSVAEELQVLYGGSAKPDNAAGLVAQPDIDGLLVGTASLKMDSFVEILHNCASLSEGQR